jgi:hypothetical protein
MKIVDTPQPYPLYAHIWPQANPEERDLAAIIGWTDDTNPDTYRTPVVVALNPECEYQGLCTLTTDFWAWKILATPEPVTPPTPHRPPTLQELDAMSRAYWRGQWDGRGLPHDHPERLALEQGWAEADTRGGTF